MICHFRSLAAAAFILATGPAFAAGYKDAPDWPCMQRKVTEVAIGSVWSGPDIAPFANSWYNDPAISDAVSVLAPRRTSLDDAKTILDQFVKDHPQDASQKLVAVYSGIYHTLVKERADVQKGIERFARKQKQAASDLKQKTADLSAAQEKGDTPREQLAKTYDELMFETRVFEDRERMVSPVCEVPTIIEQRLGAIGKLVQERIKP